MNDFMRDKFTPKKGEGRLPLYGEVIAGGTVSQLQALTCNMLKLFDCVWSIGITVWWLIPQFRIAFIAI